MKSLTYYLLSSVIKLKGVKKIFSELPIDYQILRKDDIHSPTKRDVLGLDFQYEIDAQTLQKTVNILQDLEATVNLLTIAEASDKAKESGVKIRELLKNVPHTFSVIEGNEFADSVLAFAKSNHADLIITFPRKHNLFELFFKESNTERLAFNDEIPILAVV